MSTPASSCALREVTVRRGTREILAKCTFAIPSSVRMALLGASGSGKSTVLHLLAGLEAPTEGRVLVNEVVASEAGRIVVPASRRHIAMVFQDLGLWPAQTALQNVLIGLDGSDLSQRQRRKRAVTALEVCRIDGLGGRMPSTLSGGEQQRVALARAIAVEPAMLFLDEPFAGLDLVTKAALLDDIGSIASERALTVCLVTHDPTEALALCTHAALLEDGRVSRIGSWRELMEHPQGAMLEAFRACYDMVADSGVTARMAETDARTTSAAKDP